MSKEGAQRRNVFMMDPDDLVVIGHDTKDGEEHPLYDERVKLPLTEDMVKNIQVYGVLEPVLAQTDGDRTLVVDGRRRVLHAREAAKRQKKAGEEPVKVPVFFKRGEAVYLFGVSRSANAMRVDDGPMTNARNAQRMLDMGATEEEVAVAFGVTPQSIKTWVSLLDLSSKVQHAVAKREIGIAAACTLAKLPREEQDKHLEELRAQGVKPTAENLDNKVRVSQGRGEAITPKSRIKKAVDILTKVADSTDGGLNDDLSKEELWEVINRLCKALTSKGLAKLVTPKDDEKAA